MPNIERMLELNTRLEGGNVHSNVKKGNVVNQNDLDKLIENFDRQVYGPIQKPILKEGEQEPYSAQAEMERLKKINENGGHRNVNVEGSNIPQNILESIINNPLDLDPNFVDAKMVEFQKKISENMNGIKKSVDVLKEVEKRDQKAKQKLTEQSSSTNIDYENIKTLIEDTINKKFDEFKQTLNESTYHSQNYVPSMKILNFKDKFHFVDNDDNVFICEMKYLGKRKRKKS